MSQKTKIILLHSQGNNANQIRQILLQEHGNDAYKLPTIYKWIRMDVCHVDIENSEKRLGRPPDEMIDIDILKILSNYPNASSHFIANKLKISQSTVMKHLNNSLKFKFKKTKWIPHLLSSENRQQRINLSKQIIEILENNKRDNFYNIITGDQSWFYYRYDPKGRWLFHDEDAYEAPVTTIDRKKIMLTVFWNPSGFLVVDFLPEGQKYNSEYFIDNILIPLRSEIDKKLKKKTQSKFYLHLDNCKVHTSKITSEKIKELDLIKVPHPPYSPDIAPSDFYLFGDMKRKLQGKSFDDPQDLKESILRIISKISPEILNNVFKEWLKRCRSLSESDGSYL